MLTTKISSLADSLAVLNKIIRTKISPDGQHLTVDLLKTLIGNHAKLSIEAGHLRNE